MRCSALLEKEAPEKRNVVDRRIFSPSENFFDVFFRENEPCLAPFFGQ
jgi:hypothetical protein